MNISRWVRQATSPQSSDAPPPADPAEADMSAAWANRAGMMTPGSAYDPSAFEPGAGLDDGTRPLSFDDGAERGLSFEEPGLAFDEPAYTNGSTPTGHDGGEGADPWQAGADVWATRTPMDPMHAAALAQMPATGVEVPEDEAEQPSWPSEPGLMTSPLEAPADDAAMTGEADAWPEGDGMVAESGAEIAVPELDEASADIADVPDPNVYGSLVPGTAPAPAASAASAASASAPLTPQGGWSLQTAIATVQPRSASEVLGELADKVSVGAVDQYQPVPLGFTPLDKTIGGGIRAGELLLIGGAQGTGKTTMAVQMARNIVLGGQASVLYICFEHDEEYLLNRIIAMESVLGHLPAKTGGVKLQDVRREILGTWLAQGNDKADLSANPRLKPALDRINRYGQNLYLMRGSQSTSTVENMGKLIEQYKKLSGDRRLVVFIDYMQKVPVYPEPNTETEKVTLVVQSMKDVALSLHVPMISIVAADKEGLKAARLRNHHLRGSSAINYEADIILILNEKYQIVAKVNIEFNPYQAQRFRDWVICTVEKNRGGQNAIDLEYHKYFEFSCFDANGRTVQEKLIEERLYND